MKEYFAQSNGDIYFMSADYDEVAVFDSFGQQKALYSYREGLAVGGIRSCKPVKLLSISGSVSSNTDVYFDGKRKTVSGWALEAFMKVNKSCAQYLVVPIPCRLFLADSVPVTVLAFKEDFTFEKLLNLSKITDASGWVEL